MSDLQKVTFQKDAAGIIPEGQCIISRFDGGELKIDWLGAIADLPDVQPGQTLLLNAADYERIKAMTVTS